MTPDADWTSRRFRIAFGWSGRQETTAWDEDGVAVFRNSLSIIFPDPTGQPLKEEGLVIRGAAAPPTSPTWSTSPT